MANEDFIQYYKNKYSYYYFDNYKLDENCYIQYIPYYLNIFKNVISNVDLDKNLTIVTKLKLLAQKSKNEPWRYPIVIYKNFVTYGSGRVLIDRFVFEKENEKTILITEDDLHLPNNKLETLDALLKMLCQNTKLYQEDGLILAMDTIFKNDSFEISKHQYYLKNKDLLYKQIQNVKINDFYSIIEYIKRPL